jgi:ABC-type sugar transport system substrate-binding protein
MKKVLVLFLVALLILSSSMALAGETKPLKIGYYGMSPNAGFSKEFFESVKNAVDAHGHEMIPIYTDFDAAKMRSAYEQFKMQGVDVIIDENEIKDSMTPFVEQALIDGIPYIACFVTYDEIPEAYTYGPSNQQMGAASGEFLGKIVAEEWDGKCDLILMVGTFASAPDITVRLTSALPVFSEYVDTTNTKVQEIAATAGNASASFQLVMDALTANPGKKTVIFCQTDDMANAAQAAVEAAGRANDVVLTGSDCIDAAQEYWQTAIKEGNLTAPWRGSVFLNTSTWGEAVIEMAEKMVAGTQEEHNVVAKVAVAGMSNWEEFFPDLMERDFKKN